MVSPVGHGELLSVVGVFVECKGLDDVVDVHGQRGG